MLSAFRRLPLLFFALLVCAASPRFAVAAQGDSPEGPSDKVLLKAWRDLAGGEQEEVIEWFRAEVEWVGTFQMRLVQFVLKDPERPPLLWPEAERAPLYDPETHAPAQPIRRKWLDGDSSAATRFRDKVFKKQPARRLDSAWEYDYATREIRRTKPLDDTGRIFRNALAGFPPDLDMAEALVERLLDDGSQATLLTAFSHGYTDRLGNAYPGITLYDVWGSGVEMEMPDVDTLGIVHDVLDDWRTWRAPVSKQESLYEKIGELYADAVRHRGLRHALARSFLIGNAVLRDGYQGNLVRLHALWDMNSSTPGELLGRLPDVDGWEKWLKKTFARIDRTKKLRVAGEARIATLEADSLRVRATLVRVMREFGALD